jgi:hypothetical protein
MSCAVRGLVDDTIGPYLSLSEHIFASADHATDLLHSLIYLAVPPALRIHCGFLGTSNPLDNSRYGYNSRQAIAYTKVQPIAY